MDLAKGVRKYLCTVMFAIGSYSPSGAYAAPQETPKYENCTPKQQNNIDSLDVVITLSDNHLRVNGKTSQGQKCQLLEQRVITGKRGWGTPTLDSEITYAVINPYWYPTESVVKEMSAARVRRGKEPLEYRKGMRMRPGKYNPMGKVKFSFPTRHRIKIHGSRKRDRKLFKRRYRRLSHGCIRVEDEVGLLKKLIRYHEPEQDYKDGCIDKALKNSRGRRIKFKKPIRLQINKR